MKKITGTYKDWDNFQHVVFYDRSKRKYIKLIYNEKGNYCSSAAYTKEQIPHQIAGMKKIS